MATEKRNTWGRRLRALYYKIVREHATPGYIARGWAIGMFFGCVIPFGFQLILSIPTSFILKGSKIGASLGTLITNPVTIFFIYPAQCFVGSRLIGGSMSFAGFDRAMRSLLSTEAVLPPDATWPDRLGTWFSIDKYRALLGLGQEVVASFFAGGFLLAAICVPSTYLVVLYIVRRYQATRAERLARKLNKLQEKQHILEVELMHELVTRTDKSHQK